jgi:hypothetical protein
MAKAVLTYTYPDGGELRVVLKGKDYPDALDDLANRAEKLYAAALRDSDMATRVAIVEGEGE